MDWMKRGTGRVAKALAVCVLGFLASPAMGQAPPPVRPTIDANGVDLFRGQMQFSMTDVVIGQPGAGGLTFERFAYFGGSRHSYVGTMYSNGDIFRVSIGEKTWSFTRFTDPSSGHVRYINREGTGSALFRVGSEFIFRSSQGFTAVFDPSITTSGYVSANEGFITSLTYANGEKLTFHYATVQICAPPECASMPTIRRLDAVTNNLGYRLRFDYQYPGSGNFYIFAGEETAWLTLYKVTGINMAVDPASQVWPSATYTSPGTGVEHITDALGRTTIYTRTSPQTMTLRYPGSTSDDVVVTYAQQLGEYRVSSVSVAGTTWQYSYSGDSATRTTTISGPLGYSRTVTFDVAKALPTSETDSLSNVTTYEYDFYGRLGKVTLPTQETIEYQYDERGNVTQTTRTPYPAGLAPIVTSAGYDFVCSYPAKCNKPNWTKDAKNGQTDYVYDNTHGGVLSVSLPAPTAGAPRPTTTYSYGTYYAYFRNNAGVITASPDPVVRLNGISTCRTTSSCAGGADELRTDIGYGPAGPGIANNLLPATSTVKDGANSVSSTTTSSYDPVGNLISVDGPLPGAADTTTTLYDELRRVVGVIGPDPDGPGGERQPVAQKTTYNPKGLPGIVETGNVSSVASWSSFVTRQTLSREFDGAGRVTKSVLLGVDGTQAVVQAQYDALGRVECEVTRMNPAHFGSLPAACTATPPGLHGPDRVTRYSYDSLSRTTAVVSGYPGSGLTLQTMSYSGTRLQSMSDGRGNVTGFEYDGFGRTLRIRYPDATVPGVPSPTDYEEMEYDLNSQMVSLRRRDERKVFIDRDALNRITVKNVPDTVAEDIYFSYDNHGRLLSARHGSTAGDGIVQGYDGLGRLSSRSVFGRTISYQYDAAGRRTQLTYPGPNSFFVTNHYNAAGELTAIVDDRLVTVASFSYDALGRRTALTRPNGTVTTYSYDGINHLTALHQDLNGTSSDGLIGLGYSQSGQIVTRSQSNDAAYTWYPPAPNTSVSATFDGKNRLAQFNGVSIGSTANMEVTSGLGTLTFNYDAIGQLRGATAPGQTVTVDYDPFGMLSKVTHSNGSVTEYLYDGPNLLATYDTTDGMSRFVHADGIDEPVVWYRGDDSSDPRYFHADERGSIVAVTDGSGAALGTTRYSADGEFSGAPQTPFSYTGQVWIGSLGLYYYKARMYSPKTGRFMQPDPIGYLAGMNLYAYGMNDPINRVDPMGLDDECTTRKLETIRNAGQTPPSPLPECVIVTGHPPPPPSHYDPGLAALFRGFGEASALTMNGPWLAADTESPQGASRTPAAKRCTPGKFLSVERSRGSSPQQVPAAAAAGTVSGAIRLGHDFGSLGKYDEVFTDVMRIPAGAAQTAGTALSAYQAIASDSEFERAQARQDLAFAAAGKSTVLMQIVSLPYAAGRFLGDLFGTEKTLIRININFSACEF